MEKEQFIKQILPLRKKLIAYSGKMLEDEQEAEDIVQEVFLKLWSIRHTLEQYKSIDALCMQITKRLSINRIKTKQRNTQLSENLYLQSNELSPYRKLTEKDELEKVMQIIDNLPDLQQTILKMKHIEGLEVEEIVEITGSNAMAVRMNLSRARKRVKEIFFKMQRI